MLKSLYDRDLGNWFIIFLNKPDIKLDTKYTIAIYILNIPIYGVYTEYTYRKGIK